jgi:GNAT superfamily N-acetyltransferase
MTDVSVREVHDSETGLVYDVMAELRQHLTSEEEFVERVNRRQRPHGYRLFAAFVGVKAVAAAGFRVDDNLATGRHIYVDDLVTRANLRGHGYAARLLAWLHDEARAGGCGAIHLDCGVQRHDAHRFYFAQGMRIGGYHFELAAVDADAPSNGSAQR